MITICPTCGKANSSADDACRGCGLPLHEGVTANQPPTTHAATPTPARTTSTAGTDLSGKSTREARDEQTTVRLATNYYSTRVAHDAPLSFELYFPHALVTGYPTTIFIRIKNLTSDPLELLDILLESQGLERSVSERVDYMAPGRLLQLRLPLELVHAGSFVLQCSVKFKIERQLMGFIGARPLSINAAPTNPDQAIDWQGILTNRDTDAAAEIGAAAEPVAVQSANLDELLRFKLPEKYQPLNLSLDYQISQAAVSASTEQLARQLVIHRLFLGYVQSGTVLKLTPTEPAKTRALHLVSRPQFKIGRNRSLVDFITWFWPRSKSNDEKTRHLSQVHVLAECLDKVPLLRNVASFGGSTFDGKPLSDDKGEPLNRRAPLALGGEYFLDVLPVASAYVGDLVIRNINLWAGPAGLPKPARGAVRFSPINTELAHHDAVWLFTDAAFGTSRSNPIVLTVPGLAEIQGRFHHYRGCFWVENRAANQAVSVNSQVLNANEIVPLMNGLILQLGDVSYRTEVVG